MKIKIYIILILFFLQFSLAAQSPTPLKETTHYIFFYAYEDAEELGDYYKGVVVSKIYKDTAQTHYLFKLLNLKNRALKSMEQQVSNYDKFKKINTDFSSTEKEANAKLSKLKEIWERNKTIVHHIDFVYENATGQEYPEN
ncbi:MAG: hypothetical protein ACNS60_18310 [Candidatus Cyclobacteriaceae bacterium M2_1C_046]